MKKANYFSTIIQKIYILYKYRQINKYFYVSYLSEKKKHNRKTAKAESTITGTYTCQKPLGENDNFAGFTISNIGLQNPIFDSKFFAPSNNPCELGYVCSEIQKTDNTKTTTTTTTCVAIAS